MSFLHPSIDTQHLIDKAVNSKGLGTLSREEDKAIILRMSPEQYQLWLKKQAMDAKTPANWRAVDTDLTKIGSIVSYSPDGKSISRYNSLYAQTKINAKQIKTPSEKILLSGVDEVAETLDLKRTSLESLGTIKKIGGTLYIDTASALKDLSSLKEVGDSIVVYGRSDSEIKQFLEQANFSFKELGNKIRNVIKFI